MRNRFFCLIILAFCFVAVHAQITGTIIDAENGDSLPYVRIKYTGRELVAVSRIDGSYSIPKHTGESLQFSMFGYKTQTVKITNATTKVNIILEPDMGVTLKDVDVKSKKKVKYSRKNNPAVDLMRRIIEANKKNNLKSNDFYEYYKYQKVTFAHNNVDSAYIDSLQQSGSKEWMTSQVEKCVLNDKLILPLQTNETVTRTVYRKSTDSERNTILGENKNGMMSQLSTMGEHFNLAVKECFVDVDIYNSQVKLLQQGFTSPISNAAIGFYHFYIVDTVMVGDDKCYDLYFAPNNHQDVGFSGHLYALADSSLHIRRVELTLPQESGVNFVSNMQINQEFIQLPDGQWVLDSDDMLAELYINKLLSNAVIIRRTKYSGYSFEELAKRDFRGNSADKTVPDATHRDDKFWNAFRTVELTESEKNVNKFSSNFFNRKGWRFIYHAGKVIADDYIPTAFREGKPNYFDFGPLNTMIGKNFVDGWRTRLSARTTTALSKHFFWRGYVACGFGHPVNGRSIRERYRTGHTNIYYDSELTYSFNKKEKEFWEFPIKQIVVSSGRDIMAPYDKFLTTNKDNWFMLFHVKPVHKYYIYNHQQVKFQYELRGGLSFNLGLKTETMEGVGEMTFYNMDEERSQRKKIRINEINMLLRYAPGETFVNTKLRRYPLTFNTPILIVNHVTSVEGVLGGNYKSNYSEISLSKRFWLASWGKMDFYVAGKAQWNKVPFPLLIMPTTNLSFLSQHETHTFELMDNMEFLTDRAVQWQWQWDLNGKIFNRIPLLSKLKWREVILFRGMWGHLTDKNNAMLRDNEGNLVHANDKTLMRFPTNTHIMNDTPYMEIAVGIHNIFKVVEIDYVHRLTYRDNIDLVTGKQGFWNDWYKRFRLGVNFAF